MQKITIDTIFDTIFGMYNNNLMFLFPYSSASEFGETLNIKDKYFNQKKKKKKIALDYMIVSNPDSRTSLWFASSNGHVFWVLTIVSTLVYLFHIQYWDRIVGLLSVFPFLGKNIFVFFICCIIYYASQ